MNFNMALLLFINEKLKACQLGITIKHTILFGCVVKIQQRWFIYWCEWT